MSENAQQGFKRINFFKGFLTTEKDWNDAERYHIDKRRLHNRLMHSSGIIYGYAGDLKVSARDRMQDFDAYMNPATHQLQQTIYMATYNDTPAERDDIFRILAKLPPKEVEDLEAPAACKLESYEATPTYEM